MQTTTSPTPPSTAPAIVPDRISPEQPPRKSPRPGHLPRPSTDPRQFIAALLKRYYGHTPRGLDSIARSATPFESAAQLIPARHAIESENRFISTVLSRQNRAIDPSALVASIRSMQTGRENQIVLCIREFIEEMFGENAPRILSNVDLELGDNDPAAVRTLQDLEKHTLDDDSAFTFDADAAHFLAETIRRAEIYSLLIQGFSILHTASFLRFAAARRTLIPENLSQAYRDFNLASRLGHLSVFHLQLTEGKNQLLAPEHSLGESDVCYDPVVNRDNADLVDEMLISGRATSPVGLVLAHEVLKTGFQVLTPWAKLRENYLDKNEWLALRLLANSPFAEMRQFALGPAIHRQIIDGFRRAGIETSLRKAILFDAIEEWFSEDDKDFSGTFKRLLG